MWQLVNVTFAPTVGWCGPCLLNVLSVLKSSSALITVSGWCRVSGCDCGLYVVCITEFLCQQKLASATSNNTATLQSSVTPQTVANKRRQLKELIHSLSSSSVVH